MLIIIEPRPSELCSRGGPQMSPVTLGSAKETWWSNSKFLGPSSFPTYLSTQHTDLKQGHSLTWIFRTLEGIRKAVNERNLNEGQWEDRKQWSLGVGERRTFWNRHTYIHCKSLCNRCSVSTYVYHQQIASVTICRTVTPTCFDYWE